jgi:hypothetical protein
MRPDLGGGGMSRTFREVEERSRVAVAVACGAGPGRRERLGRVPVERRADDVGGEAEPQQRHQSSHEHRARAPRGRPSRHSAVTRWGERERGAEEGRGVESPARRPRWGKGARDCAFSGGGTNAKVETGPNLVCRGFGRDGCGLTTGPTHTADIRSLKSVKDLPNIEDWGTN